MEGIVPEIAYIHEILSYKLNLQCLRGFYMENLYKLRENKS